MSEQVAAQPELFSPTGAGNPSLNGGRCRACGYVFFPPQSYGCESCGAPGGELEAVKLDGRGTLESFATVHLHQGRGIEAPFTVGVITLADGPVIRALMTRRRGEGLKPGMRVAASRVPMGTDDTGRQVVELWFEPAEGAR
jgi:hypothetical protein